MTQVTVWAGWLGGVAIGLYMLFQVVLTGRALGASSAYGNLCALGSRLPFFRRGEYAERFNWRFWFLLGLPLGGLAAALSSSPVTWTASFEMGPMYEQVLPGSVPLRGLVLFTGGMLIGIGARLAGGCNSGHTIMGVSLLNPPSILASILFFAGGTAMVQVLFRVFG
jgi:uncharacterized protein